MNGTGRVCRYDAYLGVHFFPFSFSHFRFFFAFVFFFFFLFCVRFRFRFIFFYISFHSFIHTNLFPKQLQETLLLPVSGVTSCVFGGVNMDQLFITTRRKNGESHSGGIYVASRLGSIGAPPYLYSG